MKIENIFTEFMSLYYKSNGIKPSSLKDISIGSGVIARLDNIGCTVYYLTTGNHIRIPWEYIDLFSSLNTYSGNRILSLNSDTDVEKFIQLFVRFINLLNNGNLESNNNIASVLMNILDFGTRKFREWYLNKFNRSIEPVEFFSPDKNFEI